MSKNKKKYAYIGGGVLLLAGIGGAVTVLQSPDKEKEPELVDFNTNSESTHVFSMTPNGLVSLHQIQDGKLLHTFDLKTLATGKTKPIIAPTPKEVNVPAPVVVEKPTDMFQNFEKVELTINAGQNVWEIQESLTPDENMMQMLGMLYKVNVGQDLHPVYPGEKRIFLREKSGNTDSIVEAVPTPTPVEQEEVVEKPSEVGIKDSTYFYQHNKDFTKLYAYNDVESTFYVITQKGEKVQVKILMNNLPLESFTDFVVGDGKIYATFENGKKLAIVNEGNGKVEEVLSLKGVPTWLAVHHGNVFYAHGDKIAKLNNTDWKETEILIGDTSEDYAFVKDKLYALNSFGKDLENNVLIQVSPEDMKVLDLIELKSNNNVFLNENGNDDVLYISQKTKKKNLDGTFEESEHVLPIKEKSLQKNKLVKKIPVVKNALSIGQFVYQLSNEQLHVISATTGENISLIETKKAEQFMPILHELTK